MKNWERIRRGAANLYPKLSSKNAQDESLLWVTEIESILTGNGLGNLFRENTQINTRSIAAILSLRLTDMFHQNAFSTINDEDSKLRTFGIIKSSIGLEKYLKKVKNLKHRISLSRLRLSSHRLMIETGRHKKIAASERFCSFWQTPIEDEIHFVIK